MLKAGTKRAASRASRKRITINTNREWFTAKVKRAIYSARGQLREHLKRCAAKDGISLAELAVRCAEEAVLARCRQAGMLRKCQREASEIGISLGHYAYAVWWPDPALN